MGLLERAGHAHLEVVRAKARGLQRIATFPLDVCNVGVPRLEPPARAIECAIHRRRPGALVGTQVAIARAQREAVLGPYGRGTDDLHRQAEILHRGADDRQLLVVLLAEDRDVRLHEVQQLHDDRGDALEVPRTESATEDVRQLRHVHDRAAGRALRIHLVDRRQEQHVRAELGQQRGIIVRSARVRGKILVRAELQRIHEHACDHAPAVVVRRTDQARVSRVQVAHGRHERDAFAREAPLAHDPAQLRDAADRLHRGPRSSAPARGTRAT